MEANPAQDVWLLLCTGLVFFMQPGFLCLEAGTVRRRNAVNVAMKNFAVELVSTIAFLVVGYGLMFGPSLGGAVGAPRLLLHGASDRDLLHFLFQAVFCGTAATIVSGAVAERLRFLPFVLESTLLCAFLYPLFGHWVWGGGWLAGLGYHDFAGSSVVHLMGAGVSLAGALLLGPRLGRFDASGKPREIAPSDLVLSSLGTFILIFGWIGFNGGSAPLGDHTARIVASTLVAACFGGVAAMLSSWALRGHAEIGLVLNGTLGGLVAITSCADLAPFGAAPLAGLAAGLVVHAATWALERLRIDDAVGAIPVHGACGLLGILLVPLLAGSVPEVFQGSRAAWMGIQLLGAAGCLTVSVLGGAAIWKAVSLATALRVSPEGEALGMNYSEHRLPDPVADLTAAVGGSSRGGLDPAALRGTEFEPLGRALRKLLDDLREREETQTRLRGEAEGAGLRLEQARLVAHGGHRDLGAELEDAAARLERLEAFSRSQTAGAGNAAAMAVVADLARELARSLRAAQERRILLEGHWTRVQEVAAGLARLVSTAASPEAGHALR